MKGMPLGFSFATEVELISVELIGRAKLPCVLSSQDLADLKAWRQARQSLL